MTAGAPAGEYPAHMMAIQTMREAATLIERNILSETTSGPDYKVLWERDSTALGKCLQQIHTLRAVKEDQRARIAELERELADSEECYRHTFSKFQEAERRVADLEERISSATSETARTDERRALAVETFIDTVAGPAFTREELRKEAQAIVAGAFPYTPSATGLDGSRPNLADALEEMDPYSDPTRARLLMHEAAATLRAGRIPLDPTAAMIDSGAQRLVSWGEKSKWPESWDALQVRAARNDAEKCWRSMWLAAADVSDSGVRRG